MSPVILLIIFAAATLAGFLLIKNVPALLHTPLMSGMNALSGIMVLGAIGAVAAAAATGSRVLGWAAVILAMVNMAGGFGVTHRMLKMFRQTDAGSKREAGAS